MEYLAAICFFGVYPLDTVGDPIDFHGKQTPSKLEIIVCDLFKTREVCQLGMTTRIWN